MKKITIGIPCFNEELNIERMYLEIKKTIKVFEDKYIFDILFADNGSEDGSEEILRKLAANDKMVKVILNQKNFGVSRSIVNIFRNVSSDAYIGIPCDFQDPPELIPQFIEEWENGHDIVMGQKVKSKEFFLKYLCRKMYYGIIRKVSDSPQIAQITGFGLLDKKVIDKLLITQLQDPEYDQRNLYGELGFDIKLIPYIQNKRERGKSSYNITSYFHFAVTSLVNTSIKPLHIMTVLGVSLAFICFCVAIFYFVYKLTHWFSFDVGMAPLVIGLFFVCGIQLFCIGILGEYIAVLIRRVTNKPLVIEKEKINFDE